MRAIPAICRKKAGALCCVISFTALHTFVHTHIHQLHLSSLSDTGLSQLASSSSTDLTRRPAYLARVSVPDPCFAADSHRRSHSPLRERW